MAISVKDLFTIGIGPSSSHTVGPMRAARRFVEGHSKVDLENVARVSVELFGSLGLTGIGHGTDCAVLLGLEGETPEGVDPSQMPKRAKEIVDQGAINLAGNHQIPFDRKVDLVFHRRKTLPTHPNGMEFSSYTANGNKLLAKRYYSVGGGFVHDDESGKDDGKVHGTPGISTPYPFGSCAELLEICRGTGFSIWKVMIENEGAFRPESETRGYLLDVWRTMEKCIEAGFQSEGLLPGGLKVQRRAAALYQKLKIDSRRSSDPLRVLDWVNLYALSVNEENAAGGRVVTAPTNGAAGIIPAVISYVRNFVGDLSDETVIRFLLTAGAIAILYKENASISGAEVGCQGEVGVACSMAAGALAATLGGTPQQVENAAEIGIEHNLGLTCDPIGGLVQVPCIERNAMGAVKAINAARLALLGDGTHKVHLDRAIATMYQTGADMMKKYKETSRGGLAVNVIEC
jgi:L-serine dehydratase